MEAARSSERTLAAAEAEARWLGSSGLETLQLVLDVYDLTWWLAPAMAEIDGRPDLAAVEIVRAPAGQGLAAVLEGRADAIVAPAGAAATSHAWKLFDDDLVAVVGRGHPLAGRDALTPEDFVDASYVTYSTTPQNGFEYATFFAPRQVWPGRILRVESVMAMTELVAAGRWLSILPRWTVPRRGVAALPLDPNPPAISWSLLSRDLRAHPALLRTAEHLAEHLPALLRQSELGQREHSLASAQ